MIHKVKITPEAEFDYEECLELGNIPKQDLKDVIEDYLYIKQSERKIVDNYFRIKYLDEKNDKMLMLFIKQSMRFVSMQVWEIKGICMYDDFDEDYEQLGKNKTWYKSSLDITLMPKTDWVKEIGKNTCSGITVGKINGLDKEVKNAILHRGNKGNFKKLPSIQGANRKCYCATDIMRKDEFHRKKY